MKRPLLARLRFQITDARGKPAGHIVKDEADIVTGMFSRIDEFTLDFGGYPWTAWQKALLLTATFTIDRTHFRQRKRRRSNTFDLDLFDSPASR